MNLRPMPLLGVRRKKKAETETCPSVAQGGRLCRGVESLRTSDVLVLRNPLPVTVTSVPPAYDPWLGTNVETETVDATTTRHGSNRQSASKGNTPTAIRRRLEFFPIQSPDRQANVAANESSVQHMLKLVPLRNTTHCSRICLVVSRCVLPVLRKDARWLRGMSQPAAENSRALASAASARHTT